ncbi:MAG: ATP-dependent helicase [Candidatus Omnitrophica bacterium]|nr:ATP-dependent helicase [Candidatus Omnitrophota bacterium]
MENKFPFEAIIKEASAGTGKTHSIINEIIDLKRKYGSYDILKKIIGVTFSENAAIELKERLIYSILNNEYKNLNEEEKIKLQNILLRLNFSTIHSFGRKILKRFSFFINIDPFFQIIDERESNIFFTEALVKTFYKSERLETFYKILKKIKLNRFSELMFKMKELHPYVFLGKPLSNSEITEMLSKFYGDLNKEYFEIKKKLGCLDFNDLEILTYQILTENPESLLILEDFDEKINFIFIDEFQDTNLLQWEIIKKLIEEWISGYGAKAEKEEKYGIYIVGDKKQSIYKFRGAERNLFEEAKKTLKNYYKLEKLKENYRSSEKIINFINNVFKNDKDWVGEELIFSGKIRDLPTEIEIATFDNKEEEYEWICNKISVLLTQKNILVFDRKNNTDKKLEFKDVSILIRKRSKNFKILEEKLKKYNIPYVIIGGIGFYQEPEIKFLLSLLYVLIDPTDLYSMWNVKNSIFEINDTKIENWRKLMEKVEISMLIEKILKEIDFWNELSTQQSANVEKFLSILQSQSYLPYYQIAKNFREISYNTQEPKADIFSIHQNAVKIMTVHGAKGLESPIVFIPNLEDFQYVSNKDDFFYKKEDEGYVYVYKKESDRGFEEFFKDEMIEEENRILYVALTRAMQFLFISGIKNGRGNIFKKIENFRNFYSYIFEKGKPFKFEEKIEKRKLEFPIKYTSISSYSKEKKSKGISYFETTIGSIVHRIIQEISNGIIEYNEEKIEEKIIFYLKKEVENVEYYKKEIFRIFNKIKENKKIENIIKERVSEKVKSEYPFIYEMNGKIYEGVIDKMFIERDKIKIYEFKVYFKSMEEYKKQMEIYKNGVKRIFNIDNIECFIVNLDKCEIISID